MKSEDMEEMREQLLSLVESLENEEGMNLNEDYPLFKWVYEQRPDIEFQLLIRQMDEDEIPIGATIH